MPREGFEPSCAEAPRPSTVCVCQFHHRGKCAEKFTFQCTSSSDFPSLLNVLFKYISCTTQIFLELELKIKLFYLSAELINRLKFFINYKFPRNILFLLTDKESCVKCFPRIKLPFYYNKKLLIYKRSVVF